MGLFMEEISNYNKKYNCRVRVNGRACKNIGTGAESMTLEELRKEVPELENYLKYMPKELEHRYWIKTYAPGVMHPSEGL